MKLIKTIFFILFLILISSSVYAFNLCEKEPKYGISFFNGVLNSEKKAGNSLDLLKARYGDNYKGTEIRYELFYNTSVSFKKDVWEAILMRQIDAKRLPEDFLKLPDDTIDHYELFWSPAVIENGKKTIDTAGIYNTLVNLVSVVDEKVESEVEKRMADGYPTYAENVREHKEKIMIQIRNQEKILLIAHSQGNLFVNIAFDNGIDFLKKEFPYTNPSDTLKTLKVIHVAPASTVSRGPYLLSDSDIVINGLRKDIIFGQYVPRSNLTVPRRYPLRSCGSKGEYEGHGFKEIYMNDNLLDGCDPDSGYDLPVAKLDELVYDAFSTLQSPPPKERGFFTVSMRTISEHDAYFGLVVVEPGGKRIYKHGMSSGTYGLFSSYKDDEGVQVQQYEENCDITGMLGGVYEVGVAQYTGSFDDKVVVEVKRFDGLLMFRSKPFGMTSLNNFTSVHDFMHVVDIRVVYNFATKRYDIVLDRVLDVRR